jgi:hypothetical protein
MPKQKQPSRQTDEPSTFLAGANSAKPSFLQAIEGKEAMSEPARVSAKKNISSFFAVVCGV